VRFFLDFATFCTFSMTTIFLQDRILQVFFRVFLWVRPPPFKHYITL
jgi:hypothetical protein